MRARLFAGRVFQGEMGTVARLSGGNNRAPSRRYACLALNLSRYPQGCITVQSAGLAVQFKLGIRAR
jgi:hypothetical protein